MSSCNQNFGLASLSNPVEVWLHNGGASLAPLGNENLHCVNSKMATVHYCSKRVAPYSSEIRGQAPPVVTLLSVMFGESADCNPVIF